MIMRKDSSLRDVSSFLSWWLSEETLSVDCQQEFDAYYRSYKKSFTSYIRNHYASQVKDVEDLISQFDSVPELLEVGCGCGTEALWFATRGAKVLGIDLNTSRLDVARERKTILSEQFDLDINIEFAFADVFELDRTSHQVDIIWMEQAFHHIEPRSELPGCLLQLLKPGGYVVIAEINAWNPLLQFQFFQKRGLNTIKSFVDHNGKEHIYGDERITTPSAIAQLFSRHGFELISQRYFRMFPNFSRADHYTWLEDIAPQWLPALFTHYSVVMKRI